LIEAMRLVTADPLGDENQNGNNNNGNSRFLRYAAE
jgi:hypothetical protein